MRPTPEEERHIEQRRVARELEQGTLTHEVTVPRYLSDEVTRWGPGRIPDRFLMEENPDGSTDLRLSDLPPPEDIEDDDPALDPEMSDDDYSEWLERAGGGEEEWQRSYYGLPRPAEDVDDVVVGALGPQCPQNRESDDDARAHDAADSDSGDHVPDLAPSPDHPWVSDPASHLGLW